MLNVAIRLVGIEWMGCSNGKLRWIDEIERKWRDEKKIEKEEKRETNQQHVKVGMWDFKLPEIDAAKPLEMGEKRPSLGTKAIV